MRIYRSVKVVRESCARCHAGNKYLAQLTANATWVLRFDLTDLSGLQAYAEYFNFKVGGPATNYTLTSLGNYTGNAGKS